MYRLRDKKPQLDELANSVFNAATLPSSHPDWEKFKEFAGLINELQGVSLFHDRRKFFPEYHLLGEDLPAHRNTSEKVFINYFPLPTHYGWTVDDYATLYELANSMPAMLEHAKVRLERVHGKSWMVSGPISTGGGTVEDNLKHFNKVIRANREHYRIFDQMPYEPNFHRLYETDPNRWTTEAFIEEFYRPLMATGHFEGILFMENFKISRGATREHDDLAPAFGLKRIYLGADLKPKQESIVY